MTVRFNGKQIPGTHGEAMEQQPRTMVVRRFYWGNRGQTEKIGGTTGREITVDIVLHNNWTTFKQANDWIEKNLDKMGIKKLHGTLKIQDPDTPRTYKRCTFMGFERKGPIMKDEAGTIETGSNNWFAQGTLHFYQVRV